MSAFAMSTNAHNPRLKSVHRLEYPDGDDLLSINLGGENYSHVALLVTEDEWQQIVNGVTNWLLAEKRERAIDKLRQDVEAQK